MANTVKKHLYLKLLFVILTSFLISVKTDAQTKKDDFTKTQESYFPLDIQTRKILWDDSYYFETVEGTKEFDGKIYTIFKQKWKDGKIDFVYLRQESSVVFEYYEKCGAELIKLGANVVGQKWTDNCRKINYTILAVDGKLKTPYDNFKNLLVVEAVYQNGPCIFYYKKGFGYVAGSKEGKLFSCNAPPVEIDYNPLKKSKVKNKDDKLKPFSFEKEGNTFAIKGLAYLNLFESGYGGIIGVEKGFFKNHSLGIKYSYDLATAHREDTEQNNNQAIDYSHDKNLSFILEYKYYFDFKYLTKSNWSPYISLSYKSGNKIFENDRAYPHDFYYREIKYNVIGPGLGAVILLDESGRWTVDNQISYLVGKKKAFTEDASPVKTSYNTDKVRFEFLIAYNINW